jgi:hypothetical protein
MFNICDDVYMVCYWDRNEQTMELWTYNLPTLAAAQGAAENCQKEYNLESWQVYIVKHNYIKH